VSNVFDEEGNVNMNLDLTAEEVHALQTDAPLNSIMRKAIEATAAATRPEPQLADWIQPDGGLYDAGTFIAWKCGDRRATLDGEFTADELAAIAAYMRRQLPDGKEPEPAGHGFGV
jgi:hypothetical protein